MSGKLSDSMNSCQWYSKWKVQNGYDNSKNITIETILDI